MAERPPPVEDCTLMGNRRDLSCPECHTGDLITIGMNAGENGLSFTTCHMCEAKWWFKDGQLVPLASVIGVVTSK
jgi:DNA polymerase III alpha subunit (gram-positive type)